MGIDVKAYRNIRKIDVGNGDISISEEFVRNNPVAAAGLSPADYVSTERPVEVRIGNSMAFLMWRERLAALVGYNLIDALRGEIVNRPFVGIVGFQEMHGFIGTETSRSLKADFRAFEEEAQAVGTEFFALYQAMQRLFDVAADDGVVKFS